MSKVVILGGGVCGLYSALTAVRAGHEVLLLEKRVGLGGLAASKKVGANFCDYGVHMLHAFDQEIFEDIAEVMGEERIEVALDARIKWGGKSFRYPLKFGAMLQAMPTATLAKCVMGLLLAEAQRYVGSSKEDVSAEDALITFYGAPLYEYFFEEFTERYWGIHPKELSAEFVKRKMPRLSAVDTIRKMIGFGKKSADLVEGATDEETLHYSKNGAEAMPRLLAAEIARLGGVIKTAVELEYIQHEGNQVKAISYLHQGEQLVVEADQLISTIPLHAIVDLLGGEKSTLEAVQGLSYKPITMFAVLVKKVRCMEGLYTYYRNRIFHRVGEPKNAGLKVEPTDASLLICEMTCEVGDERWRGEVKSELFKDLAGEGLCEESDILEVNQLHYEHGYPVYDIGFEKKLAVVQEALSEFNNLQSIGRQGAFIYPAMHTSMRIGKKAAETFEA